jgi:hypothetical protein
MTEIHSGKETKAAVLLCPQCSGADIIYKTIAILDPAMESELPAWCGSCQWAGKKKDLIAHKFKHEMGSDEQILQSMVTDLRNLLAKEFAKSFGSFLLKWGFISTGVTPKDLSRYIVGIAQATMKAILETRQEIEKEKKDG